MLFYWSAVILTSPVCLVHHTGPSPSRLSWLSHFCNLVPSLILKREGMDPYHSGLSIISQMSIFNSYFPQWIRVLKNLPEIIQWISIQFNEISHSNSTKLWSMCILWPLCLWLLAWEKYTSTWCQCFCKDTPNPYYSGIIIYKKYIYFHLHSHIHK